MMQAECESGRDYHKPVMVEEVLKWADAKPGYVIVDATLGGGGHARALLDSVKWSCELIGIDRDLDAVSFSQNALSRPGALIRIIHGSFGEIGKLLSDAGVDVILADLGVSSFQLNSASRGFSFRFDGPLDMRMDLSRQEGASELIDRLDEEELAQIIREYGEERFAGRIARVIVAHRPVKTTAELAKIIEKAVGGKRGRIHPATRTFQALRIAVNDELGELERFLESAPAKLKKGARLMVISYHSLEDRLVKRRFRQLAAEGDFITPVKKVIVPGRTEILENPRARSAKLRILERVKD